MCLTTKNARVSRTFNFLDSHLLKIIPAKQIIFDGQDLSPKYDVPLIYMHKGRDEPDRHNLVIEGVTFRNAKHRAILVQTNNLTRLRLDDCTFESTVREVQYGGGVIYVDVNTDGSPAYKVDVHRFELNNCEFKENTAASSGITGASGYGGAIALFGNVYSGLINGCTFTNCKTTTQGGGAIDIAGGTGAMTIQNTTFYGCSSKYRGGAVEIRSTSTKNADGYERWTRMNDISFSGCTFTNCKSTDSHGGAIAVKAQLNSLSVSGCSFSGCTAGINGGAISIDGQDLPDAFGNTGDPNPSWCAALSCDTCTSTYSTIGTTMTGSYDWKGYEDSEKTIDKKSLVGTVNIANNCNFTNCSCASNGGTIEFASGMYITNSATISNTTIDGGKAVGGGSAIFTSTCIIKRLNLHDDIFKNCSFNEGAADVGGTIRTTGPTTIVLDVQGCEFLKNHSYGHAGGLYWNAAGSLAGITSEATVNDCLFDGNSADKYGGAIYVESKMTITKCNIKNNTATLMGGGIAQQVYNNPKIRMLQEGDVSELKLDPTTWIHDNKAEVGGGISIRANETDCIVDGKPISLIVRFELNGAAVYQNTASKDGGGIYFIAESSENAAKQAEVDMYTKVILINAGTGTAAAVYKNTAAGNGGGIYMESSENTELRVQGGYISSNSAVNGGGIYMTGKNAICYVEGGTIGGEGNDSAGDPLANKAVRAEGATTGGNGGGIAISGGASIQMIQGTDANGNATYGTISYNEASYQGGGIWLDDAQYDSVNQEYTKKNSITIAKGTISQNKVTAESATEAKGGGIYAGKYSTVTMTGGTISGNATTGYGGGVYITDSVMKILGGDVYGNTSGSRGGGVCVYNSSKLTVAGSIYNNTADQKGGGIYAYNRAEVEISGDVYGNVATHNEGGGAYIATGSKLTVTGTIGKKDAPNKSGTNGGGVCVKSSSAGVYSSAIIKGNVEFNEAANGGGVAVLDGANITISNGSIKANTATGSGGGVYASNGAVVKLLPSDDGSVGNIEDNTAYVYGGGVYAQINSEIVIQGGNVQNNTATTGNGGGLHVHNGSNVTITGGDITYNHADAGFGGGVHAYQNSTVTISGGNITNNTAQRGGGIAAENGSEVKVTGTIDTTEKKIVDPANVSNNTAARGGGVYVSGGAKLVIFGGFVRQNNANGQKGVEGTAHPFLGGNEDTTNNNTELDGTGGGIYICDGTEDARSIFEIKTTDTVVVDGVSMLVSADVGIYGNLAEYAADDVYANGTHTQLIVPLVSQMHLADFDFQAGGWFEDYPINDPNYTDGLNLASSRQGITDGNVYRYKSAETLFRVEIVPTDGTLPANTVDTYVCMTLGIPGAMPEDFVIDFGLSVDMNVVENDQSLGDKNYKVFLLSTDPGMEYIRADEAGDLTFRETLNAAFGTIKVNEDNSIRFTLSTMDINRELSFTYAVLVYGDDNTKTTDDFYYFATVRVIPATTIYFEENFVDFEDEKWSEVNDGTTGHDAIQDSDRPGKNVGDALGSLDMDNVYGMDSAYSTSTKYSMGVAMMTTVNSEKDATATFRFWGTGFDVISLTSNKSGTVLVNVYQIDADGKVSDKIHKSYMVDTYYGYAYGDYETVVDGETVKKHGWHVVPKNAENAIYQIPVIKAEGLDYGHYFVEVYVAYNDWFDNEKDGSYDFYLDAIRIYDPANDGIDNPVVQQAYKDDEECWPTYEELRDMLISADDFDAAKGNAVTGIVYIDGQGEISSVADYETYGPNNEIYLNKGNSITFNFNAATMASKLPAGVTIASVQISLKTVNGKEVKFEIYDPNFTRHFVNGTISTATDMYYDITHLFLNDDGTLKDAGVVIHNINSDGILSVTNIKVTYTGDPGSLKLLSDEGGITVDGQTVGAALAVLNGTTETVTQPTLSLKYGSLSFESEIRYNIYFNATDLDSVVEMGLVTFSDALVDGTIYDALEVIPGYVTDGELYMVSTNGIAARYMGDAVWFKVYAKLSDGSYVYTDVNSYDAVRYANSILGRETSSDKSKALVVALLNYGAAAQRYFGETGELMNAGLTAEQQALVLGYEDLTISGSVDADPSKVGVFTKSGFGTGYPTVSFDGIFSLNFYFQPENAVEGEMKMYYWEQDVYDSVTELTAENASGYVTMMALDNGYYCTSYSDIAAKEIEDTLYVAAVYESEGVSYCTGVIDYSLANYCNEKAVDDASAMQDLAKATAVYGYYASAYFTED